MRTLFAAAFLSATVLASCVLADAVPQPQASVSQQDAARKAWFAHAIDRILDGSGDRAVPGGAAAPALD